MPFLQFVKKWTMHFDIKFDFSSQKNCAKIIHKFKRFYEMIGARNNIAFPIAIMRITENDQLKWKTHQ